MCITLPNKLSIMDRDIAKRHFNYVEERSWDVKDQPYVKKQAGGKERSVDEMLKILRRRLRKNGKLERYREKQYHTKDAERRQERRKKIEYENEKREEKKRNNEGGISGSY